MIDSYGFGEIVVDGQRYTSDVIIYPDRVDSSWWRKEGHRLSIEDLEDIVKAKPETLIVGTPTHPQGTPESEIGWLQSRVPGDAVTYTGWVRHCSQVAVNFAH